MHTDTSASTRLRCFLSAALALGAVSCGGGGGGSTPAAPSNLSYARSFELFSNGVEIAEIPASVTGSVKQWSVSPALPAGLFLDPQSGALRGRPSELRGERTYTVRAANAGGSTDATLRLAVVRPPFLAVACSSTELTLSTFLVDADNGRLVSSGYERSPNGSAGPRALTADASGRNVYLGNATSQNIARFELEPSTGRLRARENTATQGAPEELVVHPSGQSLYVFSRQAPNIETFDIDGQTGELSSRGAISLSSSGLEAVAASRDGRFMWAAFVASGNQTVSTIEIDDATRLPARLGAPVPTTNKVRSLAVSPDGRFLYGASSDPGASTIDVFAIDPVSGALSKFDSVSVGAFATSLAIEPHGRFLYCAVSGDDTLRVFAIDANSGTLSAPQDASIAVVPTGDRPWTVRIDASGRWLYVTERNELELGAFALDADSGRLTRLDTLRTRDQPFLLTLVETTLPAQARTRFAYVGNEGSDDVTIFSAAPATGALAAAENALTFGGHPRTLARHPRGLWMYAADSDNDVVRAYTISAADGQLAANGSAVPSADEPIAAQVEGSGRFLFVLNRGSESVSSFQIDQVTGALGQRTDFAVGSAPSALTIDPLGRFATVAHEGDSTLWVLRINAFTGALVQVGAPLALSAAPLATTYDPTGRFVLAALGASSELALFDVASANGQLLALGAVPLVGAPNAIALHPTDRRVFVSCAGAVAYGRIDELTGTLTSFASVSSGAQPVDLVVEPSGAELYVVNRGANNVTRMDLGDVGDAPQVIASSLAGVGPTSIELATSFD
jgi:6-phosphogluconolactonase (cycloisomerase 2 family)